MACKKPGGQLFISPDVEASHTCPQLSQHLLPGMSAGQLVDNSQHQGSQLVERK